MALWHHNWVTNEITPQETQLRMLNPLLTVWEEHSRPWERFWLINRRIPNPPTKFFWKWCGIIQGKDKLLPQGPHLSHPKCCPKRAVTSNSRCKPRFPCIFTNYTGGKDNVPPAQSQPSTSALIWGFTQGLGDALKWKRGTSEQSCEGFLNYILSSSVPLSFSSSHSFFIWCHCSGVGCCAEWQEWEQHRAAAQGTAAAARALHAAGSEEKILPFSAAHSSKTAAPACMHLGKK